MSKFSVPEGMHGFISSAQTLLEQFKMMDVSDRVVFRVFLPDVIDSVDHENLRTLTKRCMGLHAELTSFMTDQKLIEPARYVWFKEAPLMRVVIQPIGGTSTSLPVCYLEGSLRVGDFVDDEWFVVKLLQNISESFFDICVSIVDCDGQFLLIEAADSIPDWLEPENSDNRVWLYRGKLHIIPQDVSGLTRAGSIELASALRHLRSNHEKSICPEIIQTILRTRTERLSAAHVEDLQHTSVCYLPYNVAKLLKKFPSLLSSIVEELCKPILRPEGSQRDCTTPAISNASLWKAMLRDSGHVCPIVFTRPLFAKLVFKPFHVPSILRTFRKEAIGALANSSASKGRENKAQAAKYAEVSCRLLVGLALLMKHCTFTVDSHDKKKTDCWDTANARLQRYNLCDLDVSALSSCANANVAELVCLGKVVLRNNTIHAMTISGKFIGDENNGEGEYENELPSLSEILGKEAITALLSPQLNEDKDKTALNSISLDSADSDHWLTLSENQLDYEMRRVRDFSFMGDVSANEEPLCQNEEAKIKRNDLRIKKVENMAQKIKSGLEEVVDNYKSNDDEEEEDGEEDLQNLDMSKVMSIVESISKGEDLASSQKDDMVEKLERGDCENTEKRGCEDDACTDLDYDSYQEAMERELQGSSMAYTFERGLPSLKDPLGAIDVDTNLIHNLMESHSSQIVSQAGPTSHLLTLLGSELPDPDSSASSDDEENVDTS